MVFEPVNRQEETAHPCSQQSYVYFYLLNWGADCTRFGEGHIYNNTVVANAQLGSVFHEVTRALPRRAAPRRPPAVVMGAGSAVLSKGVRELDADKEVNFDEFRAFMGTHYRPEHGELFRELAAANPKRPNTHISVPQLKEALEDQFVAAKLWRQFKKTWDGGPDWELVKQLLKSRPTAIRVRDYEVKTIVVKPPPAPPPGPESGDAASNGDAAVAGPASPRGVSGAKAGKGSNPASPKAAAGSPKSPSAAAAGAPIPAAKKGAYGAGAGQTKEVVLRRTMLDVAVDFAVTREYRLDLNALTLMHECWPELILQRNIDGDNPLHVAVATWPRSPTDVAVSLVEICPQVRALL